MMNALVGLNVNRVDIPRKIDERIRVLRPNDVPTVDKDYKRINIVVGDDDLIKRIYRG